MASGLIFINRRLQGFEYIYIMARVVTQKGRMRYPTGTGAAPLSYSDINALTSEQDAIAEFAEIGGLIASREGRRIMQADRRAQTIAGEEEVEKRIRERFDLFDTDPDESNYGKSFKETIKTFPGIIKSTTNHKSRIDIEQYIQRNRPRWEGALRDVILERKRVNTYARRDQLIEGIKYYDLTDPMEQAEAFMIVSEAGQLMKELGHSDAEVENWAADAIRVVDNQSIYQQAQLISSEKGYDEAVKWIMGQNVEVDDKKSIVRDIKFEASQKQLEYEKYVEKVEQDFLGKLRQEQLTEDEILDSTLEVRNKEHWLRMIDAQTKERLEGKVSLNYEVFNELQTRIDNWDGESDSKERISQAISDAAGKTIPVSGEAGSAVSLRLRLASKRDPDAPMNRSSAKRAMTMFNDLEEEVIRLKRQDDDYETIPEERLKWLNKKNEFERWINEQEKVTDTDIENKIKQMTTPEAEEAARGYISRAFNMWLESPFGFLGRKVFGETNEPETQAEFEATVSGMEDEEKAREYYDKWKDKW